MQQTSRNPFGLTLYKGVMRLSGPVADILLRRRVVQGKEDPVRLAERRGFASMPRPNGQLVWFHCASVGESLSILPLITLMSEAEPALHFLVTTGTLTSAQLMAERLPGNALHQFLPFDHSTYCARFFDHWKPNLGVIVESELWPNLLLAARHAHVPLALANARLSLSSFKSWRHARYSIKTLLDCFHTVFAQDDRSAERLRLLGATSVLMTGNLKFDGVALPVNEAALTRLKNEIGDRPVWVAASTHEGEERAVAQAHLTLKEDIPNLLSIIVPRHPARGDRIAEALREAGLVVAQRSRGDTIKQQTDIYLGDTLGEMGSFYSLANISFVGGSLVPVGGHNPLEPVRLDNAVLFGPHMFNFDAPVAALLKAGAACQIKAGQELVPILKSWLNEPNLALHAAEKGQAVAAASTGIAAELAPRLLALMASPPVAGSEG